MPEKKRNMDISGLSQSIAGALKEISSCGKTLTLTNLNRALSSRKEITALLAQASSHQDSTVSESELEALKSQLEAGENRRKEALRQMAELEHQMAREREFFRRLAMMLVNLVRIPENEAFFGALDDFRARVQEGADLEVLEGSLKTVKDQMLREEVGGRKRTEKNADGSVIVGTSVVRSIFGRSEKGAVEELLGRIRKECGVALQDIQTILGEEFRASVHLAQQHIERCRDLDSLITQKTYVLSLISGYVHRALKEKDQVTDFLREVSERLADLEKEMVAASSASCEVHLNDNSFNDSLESEILSFHENVLQSSSFESLRTFVVSQLTKISGILHDRGIEYTSRIEKAQHESENLKKNFRTLIGKVIDKNKALQEEIQRDPLTEIFNRRTCEITLSAELERFQRYRTPFTLIFFDVDNFKNVNDRYGHEAGDRVLKAIARKVHDTLRKPDVFARYGGEEFVVILPETGLDKGITVAMKIRELIEKTVFDYENERVPVTVSLGVTEVIPSDQEPQAIAKRADMLLYRAKAEGRNRVVSDFDVK